MNTQKPPRVTLGKEIKKYKNKKSLRKSFIIKPVFTPRVTLGEERRKVIIFGTFDRVHFGHIDFIESALRLGQVTCVVGRDKTVRSVKNRATKNTEADRIKTLRSLFPDVTFVLGHKTRRMAVVDRVDPDIICLGYDQIAFVDVLKKHIKDTAKKWKIVRLKPFNETSHKSSLLKKNAVLIRGPVVHGQKQGRTLGYPTANIALTKNAARLAAGKHGVFVGRAYMQKKEYAAAIVIGMRTSNGAPLVEAHVLEFKGDCYGKYLTVRIDAKIRSMVYTNDVEALKKRVANDIEYVHGYYSA